jgi:23S rRNA U2552 (ribose-2'-O)-methylase RlmE/FtsJ
MGIIEKTLPLYIDFLKPNGRFAIKIFMWPGFDEFVKELKVLFGPKVIKVFKPKACRSDSKEIYVVKVSN